MSSRDFGAVIERRTPVGRYVLGFAIWLCGVAGVVAIKLGGDERAAIAEAKAWTIEGAPCPRLAAEQVAAHPYQPTQAFGYAGSNFAYRHGHVACAEIHDDGGRSMFSGHPVCQFTSPAVVFVDTGSLKIYFAPGIGQRATVSVSGGDPRCVLGGKFYGQNDF